jgi:SAM-dependent methyltransferase
MTRSSTRRSPRRSSRPAARPLLTARDADRHDLYQRSVQLPDHETRLFERIFEAHTGRRPLHLREDFCGTALLCAHWAKSHPERTATGLDTSRPTLEWGRAHNLSAIGAAATRVTLLEQDVVVPTRRKFEVIAAFNYSYQVFHERELLLRYFRAAHRSLTDDGLFVLDALGGFEVTQARVERRRMTGWTYIWEQEPYDAVNARFLCHISFEFRDGTALRRCFTYDWRHYSLSELRDALVEAGFASVDAYWEGTDASGRGGSGVFRRVTRAENEPVWNAYLVARKRPPLPGTRDAARSSKQR